MLEPQSKEDKVKVTNLKNLPKFQWVLLKIQSGHDSVHRRTDGHTDGWTDGQDETSISPFQLHWSGGYNDEILRVYPLPWYWCNTTAQVTYLLRLSDTYMHHYTKPSLTQVTACCSVASHYLNQCWHSVNSSWPSDPIWQHRSGSTLAQVMACCLMAPSHYLNQCWLIISKV